MNSIRSVPYLRLVTTLLLWVVMPIQAAQSLKESPLTAEFNRALQSILDHDPLTTSDIDSAVILAQKAFELRPESASQARLLFRVAVLADRPELQKFANRRILILDPDDEAARLTRLTDAIDQFQTLEERIKAYEQLLSVEIRSRLGIGIATRLALDLALLHEHAGNLDGFAVWLAESGVIDPSNREAASLALGFFYENQNEVRGKAELLVNLIMADPTDLPAQVELALLLLNAGAYEASDRIYRLLQIGLVSEDIWFDNEMLADYATVTWALGNDEEALQLIAIRRQLLDEDYRRQQAQEQPTLTTTELDNLHGPQDIVLSTVSAVIRNSQQNDPQNVELLKVYDAYESRLAELEDESDTDPLKARLCLEHAWISIWLGSDVERARRYIDRADALIPLSEEAKTRAQGWYALRAGQPELAIELLTPMADTDSIALVGLALAHGEQNQLRDEALLLLKIGRDQPGTLLGVWAAQKLATMVGQRISIVDSAQQLTDLIDSMPHSLERQANHSTTALGFRLKSTQRSFEPYEPIFIDLEISNNSSRALTIDPMGPIRPQIALFPLLRFSGREPERQPEPFIVDIDRELRLESGESIQIRIDLRNYSIGDFLNESPLSGIGLHLTGMINFHPMPNGTFEPGLLGSSASISMVQINGVRIDNEWMDAAIDSIQGDDPDLRNLALLSHVVARPAPQSVFEDDTPLLDDARAAVLGTYTRLQPDQQAWMLSVLPKNDLFEPLLNSARKSDQPLVKMAYLLFKSTGIDDPMLDAAMRGDDHAIRIIAEMVRLLHANLDHASENSADSPDDGNG